MKEIKYWIKELKRDYMKLQDRIDLIEFLELQINSPAIDEKILSELLYYPMGRDEDWGSWTKRVAKHLVKNKSKWLKEK